MTEIEKIAYAKVYIDKLANGINPLDDTPVSEKDIVNNVRLTRCFFFVSDILRQVVENGGVKSSKKKKDDRLPFSITLEQLSGYRYEPSPSVTQIVKGINLLIDTTQYKELSYKQVVGFLVDAGVLENVTDASGRTTKRPTELGRSIGVYTESRHSQNRDYTAVVYSPQAQKFILDNIDSISKM